MPVSRAFRHCGAAAAAAVMCALAGGAPAANAADERPDLRPDSAHLTRAQRSVLLKATHRFRDVKRAVAAGYVPTAQCVPGMGFHYAHPARSGDMNIDPKKPEVLVYVPDAHGAPRLAALEYFRADADGDTGTTGDRPTLFGHHFDGPMAGHPVPPGSPPMPVHYDLHVWLYKSNPAGELSPTNPTVRCPRR